MRETREHRKAEPGALKKTIKRLDAEFAKMRNDAGYQREAAILANEFESSDWEVFRSHEIGAQR